MYSKTKDPPSKITAQRLHPEDCIEKKRERDFVKSTSCEAVDLGMNILE